MCPGPPPTSSTGAERPSSRHPGPWPGAAAPWRSRASRARVRDVWRPQAQPGLRARIQRAARSRSGHSGAVNATPAQTPVVLIHGIRVTSTMWRAQQDALASTGRPVIAVDLPGHGARSGEPFTIDGALAVVHDAVDELGRRAVVVGLSLGGYIAITYSARFPESVAGVVAADSVSYTHLRAHETDS